MKNSHKFTILSLIFGVLLSANLASAVGRANGDQPQRTSSKNNIVTFGPAPSSKLVGGGSCSNPCKIRREACNLAMQRQILASKNNSPGLRSGRTVQ